MFMAGKLNFYWFCLFVFLSYSSNTDAFLGRGSVNQSGIILKKASPFEENVIQKGSFLCCARLHADKARLHVWSRVGAGSGDSPGYHPVTDHIKDVDLCVCASRWRRSSAWWRAESQGGQTSTEDHQNKGESLQVTASEADVITVCHTWKIKAAKGSEFQRAAGGASIDVNNTHNIWWSIITRSALMECKHKYFSPIMIFF